MIQKVTDIVLPCGWSYSIDTYNVLGDPITVSGTVWEKFNAINHAGLLDAALAPVFGVIGEKFIAPLLDAIPSATGGMISGEASEMASIARRAESGDASALAEIKVAKNAYLNGSKVEVVARDVATQTPDFIIDGVTTDVKRISTFSNMAAQMAKGAAQVGENGEVIIVRPEDAGYTMEQGLNYISNFVSKVKGVTFKLVDEKDLPQAFGK